MLNVLNTQLFRLKKSKLFWALFIVCALLPLAGMLFSTGLMALVDGAFDGAFGELFDDLQSSFTMSAFAGLTKLSSDPVLFSLICSSIFLSGEFSGGAIRNMVLANKSRTQIFFSFLSVAMIIGTSYLCAGYVSTLLFYGTVMGFDGILVSQAVSGCFASLFLGLLSIAVAQTCVCLFLFATRKTGATVAFPILVIILAPSLVNTIVDLVMGVKLVVGESVTTEALSWIPLYNMSLFSASKVDGGLVGKIAVYNVPIAALFATFGWIASKADLK